MTDPFKQFGKCVVAQIVTHDVKGAKCYELTMEEMYLAFKDRLASESPIRIFPDLENKP